MAKQIDHHAELAKRKFGKPNIIPYFIYYVVGRTKLLGKQYNPKLEVIDELPKKGPAFIIWNHQSRRDHTFITSLAWPRKISIVAEYVSFFREHLHWPFKMMRIIPKKVFTNDMISVRAINTVIKKGGIVAFSPEGTSSIFGDNQPIVPGTGRFLQVFNVPVYIVHMQGSYLTNNKISSNDHIGEVHAQLQLLFSPEEIKKMKPEEIDDRINLEFKHDDYKWNKEHHIKYDSKGQICYNLQDMLYKCPRCGHEFEMDAQGDYIKCTHCGNGATMDDYYDFHPFDDKCVIPDTPTDWVHQERQDIINEIRKDPNYSFKFHCKLGIIPKDKWIPKADASVIAGEGEYEINHQGVHFKGTKNGEPFSFDLDYKTVTTYPISVDLTVFSLFVNGEEYDFYPDIRCGGKVIMLTEEMHRLHINRFKNFPWFDYMYEGKELGIDLKNK